MALNINQFALQAIQGMVDLKVGPSNLIAVDIDSSSAGGLVPGQAVKIVNVAGGIPNVVECALNSDDVFGFIVYDIKNQTFSAGDKATVAFARGTAVYMTASAAIVPNAKVAIVIASNKIVTATTGMMVVGRALDKASADGDLIRVIVDLPGAVV